MLARVISRILVTKITQWNRNDQMSGHKHLNDISLVPHGHVSKSLTEKQI